MAQLLLDWSHIGSHLNGMNKCLCTTQDVFHAVICNICVTPRTPSSSSYPLASSLCTTPHPLPLPTITARRGNRSYDALEGELLPSFHFHVLPKIWDHVIGRLAERESRMPHGGDLNMDLFPFLLKHCRFSAKLNIEPNSGNVTEGFSKLSECLMF